MSNSQGRFAGRTGPAGRPGGRSSYLVMTTGRSSLQQARTAQNSSGSSNRFAPLGVSPTEMDITQAEIEDAFQEDLPVDISEIHAGDTSRMDMSAFLDNSVTDMGVAPGVTVTPKATNPYYRNTGQAAKESKVDTTESTESHQAPGIRSGSVEESKVEIETEVYEEEPLEIPGPPTPRTGSGTRWKYYTRMDVILQVA